MNEGLLRRLGYYHHDQSNETEILPSGYLDVRMNNGAQRMNEGCCADWVTYHDQSNETEI
jgi:hypothetical protein